MSFTGFASTAQMIFVTPHSRFVAFESPGGQEEKTTESLALENTGKGDSYFSWHHLSKVDVSFQ